MTTNTPAQPAFPRMWDAAVLVKDLDKTHRQLADLGFGRLIHPAPPAGAEGLFYRNEPFNTRFNAFLIQVGNMQMEFIQPAAADNPWIDFMNRRGEGFHHIGLQVADVDREVERLTALGAEVPFYGRINGKMGAAYVDLKVANLFIELTSFCTLEADPAGAQAPRVWDMAVVVKDLDRARQRLETLGWGPFRAAPEPEGAEGMFYRGQPLSSGSRMCVTRFGNLNVELVQPDAGPNPWRDFLDSKGEGIHHLGFWVPDIDSELARLNARGAETSLYGKINGRLAAAYVDLKLADLFIELTSFGGNY